MQHISTFCVCIAGTGVPLEVSVHHSHLSGTAVCLQITQQVDEQTEGPPLTLTAVSGQSISLTTDMLKVSSSSN